MCYKKLTGKKDGRAFARDVNHYLRADLNSVVINFVDILAHSRADSEVIRELAPDEQAYRALTRTWFEHSWLYQSFLTLSKRDCTIIIRPGHGCSPRIHNLDQPKGKHFASKNLPGKQCKFVLIREH